MPSTGVFPGTSVSRPSPATNLPQEIVEMIIANLTYDTHSLLACCLTCCSWYIAAVPHLHHTLFTRVRRSHGNEKPWWPNSFRKMHKLGLFPLVKTFQVQGHCGPSFNGPTFSPELFDRHILHQFSALTNVRELGLDDLDIPSFIPNIRRYFHHFFPAVRSLALRRPRGSHRQIIFFIGLFQHLEDLTFLNAFDKSGDQGEPQDDLTLVPPFTPPLRGRLKMRYFKFAGIVGDMIGLFGGIRFRHMDLQWVDEMQLLLDACAGTLETLRFHSDYPYNHCERAVLKGVQAITNGFTVKSFNLSRNISLRTLEVPVCDIGYAIQYFPLALASTLKHVLSTITSPKFSEITLFYQQNDFPFLFYHPPGPHSLFPSFRRSHFSQHPTIFAALYKMQEVRNFKLLLCADVWVNAMECAVQELEREVGLAEGRSDSFSSWLSVTCSPRGFFPAFGEDVTEVPLWLDPWVSAR